MIKDLGQHSVGKNTRQTLRKPLRCRAQVLLPTGALLQGQTTDISTGGVTIVVAEPISLGSACKMRLELFVNGSPIPFEVIGVVITCICSNQAYRIGFRFQSLDSQQFAVLEKI